MIATQHSLVARLRDSVSNSDWRRFYTLYEKPIMAFAAARSLNEADCRDVLQETMIRMLQAGFMRFDPAKGRFTSFLFRIADGCVVDALRRRARREARYRSLDASSSREKSFAETTPNPFETAERHSQMALVGTALDLLVEHRFFREKTIALFKAIALEQKPAEEVARLHGTSVGNVYQAKHAVLTKLRTALEALERGVDPAEALVRQSEQPART